MAPRIGSFDRAKNQINLILGPIFSPVTRYYPKPIKADNGYKGKGEHNMNVSVISILAILLWAPTNTMACESDKEAGIQWYGTLDGGMEEAKKTGLPILLMSAAPQCHNISGVW